MPRPLYFVFYFLFIAVAFASDKEKVHIGLEPFPPLITEDGKGMTVDMLKEVEKLSDFKFVFTVAPYKRLKQGLLKENYDLIGHTPFEDEVPAFYKQAVELDWSYPVCTEFLYISDFKDLDHRPVVGTLDGNKEFLESFEGMKNYDIFEHVDMAALLKMLKNKRVDAVWFGRPVLNHYLNEVKIPNVKRKTFPSRPLSVGLAVRKSVKGARIKKQIEKLLKKIDWKKEFDEKFKKDLDCVSK